MMKYGDSNFDATGLCLHRRHMPEVGGSDMNKIKMWTASEMKSNKYVQSYEEKIKKMDFGKTCVLWQGQELSYNKNKIW